MARANDAIGATEMSTNDPIQNETKRKYSAQGQNSKLESMQQSLMAKIHNDQKSTRAGVQGVLHSIGQNEKVIARPLMRISQSQSKLL